MSDFRKWMDKNRVGDNFCKQIVCNSGLELSVQASWGHYCSPRDSLDSYQDYSHFEIGFPSEVIHDILYYVEDADHPTETVYGYVPSTIIQEVIDKNGGIKGETA